MNETFLLFTYGTLMKGERNEHLLAKSRFVGKAVTKPIYKLFRIDGNFVFPAIVDTGDTAVKGEVYECPMSALAGMDRMEGHPFFYCRQPVELASVVVEDIDNNQDKVDALVNAKAAIAYFFVNKDQLEDRPIIKSGDWLNR